MRVQVTAVDGREWVLRRRIEWRDGWQRDAVPAPPGRCAGVITVVVVLAGLALVVRHLYPGAWTLLLGVPVGAIVAAVVVLLVVAAVRWALGRPRMLVAEYAGDHPDSGEAEHWTGRLEGRAEARRETAAVLRSLRARGTPGNATSPVRPIT